jgi:GT2 family glycosyltransferase
MKKISIVILNWNGKDMLETFLPSVMEHSPSDMAEIVVADNGSTDNSTSILAERFPSVRIIRFEKNHGFAAGYNKAMREIDTPFAVLLNNDVEVTPGWLDAPLSILENNADVACVQPKLLSWKDRRCFEYAGAAGGYIDRYGYPFCRGRLFHIVEVDSGQYDEADADIIWATGACLFVKTNIYKEEGGLDDYFFAHQEEVDFCWRLCSRGFRIVYTPLSHVFHKGAATLAKSNPRKTFLNFRNNLLMIYKNMPDENLKPVLRIRFWLDYIAAVRFLLEGHIKDVAAVFEARRAFRHIRKTYLPVRKDNLAKAKCAPVPDRMPLCILWEFYVKGRKRFEEIR